MTTNSDWYIYGVVRPIKSSWGHWHFKVFELRLWSLLYFLLKHVYISTKLWNYEFPFQAKICDFYILDYKCSKLTDGNSFKSSTESCLKHQEFLTGWKNNIHTNHLSTGIQP